jgi:glycosyltransferase involved in cell wall biosynthesis
MPEPARASYVAITPARDECEHLPRLARCLAAQSVPPREWLVVDNGSTDGTAALVAALAREYTWIRLLRVPGSPTPQRGGPVVRAFHAGVDALAKLPDVVVKLDADVSLDSDYFERLLDAFDADPRLGIASGNAYENCDGHWMRRYVTAGHVWGPCRAYRRECLEQVLPLEERMGWDGVDELKAAALGWRTGALPGLWFRHHRRQGRRDGARWQHWYALGDAAHFMHYRLGYLLLRSLYHALVEPAAVMMLGGYIHAALLRRPRSGDPLARQVLRDQQRLRHARLRVSEALGRR